MLIVDKYLSLKCKCNNVYFYGNEKSSHYGLYCSKCDSWLKWANANERNHFEKLNNIIIEKGKYYTCEVKTCKDSPTRQLIAYIDAYSNEVVTLYNGCEMLCKCINYKRLFYFKVLDVIEF